MDPWHAAAIWPEVEQVARNYGVQKLVSPAMCGDIGKGTSWMQQFLDACKGCRIDAIAIHSYWCSLDGVQNLIEQYRRFGKKIWLTEFACAAPGVDVSMQGQIKFMKDVVPWLEQEDMVEKYAWFSYFTNEWAHGITNPNPDAGLVDWNGALSELGRVYVSLGHNRRLEGNASFQEVQPNMTQPIFP
ncbi:asl1 [Symbiodinium necroappetens]|uniref:Asl1 protein n=1 Tax=Symbiodinium necroappetens TaxID=1628268 RepID=A0A812XX29_9DINO|nr:asl1 [Symbiodinium necroappetens]